MPTGPQIRAARALLGWGAPDLAERVGMRRETILAIENEHKNPRPSTMEKILQAFKEGGVEFNGERGVNLMLEDYRLLEGSDCYLKLLDEIYYDLHGRAGTEALFICVDDSLSTQEIVVANNRIRDAGIKCRYLCSDAATKFDYDKEDYRTIRKEQFKNSVMISFGDKVATLRGANDAVLIIRDKEQAEMLHRLFDIIWDQAPKPKV